jgi:hypothetical protein
MSDLFLYAIKALFAVAVVTPPLLILLYRWKEVPLRRGEIEKMMEVAFDESDPASRKEAKAILENNPYFSKAHETFDHFHSPSRYVFPIVLMIALTSSSVYLVYSWVRGYLKPPHVASSNQPLSLGGATQPTPNQQIPVSPNPPSSTSKSPYKETSIEGTYLANPTLVLIMALAGGYIWSVYQILARIRASELSPADLYEIDLGMLAAVPIGLAFSLITVELNGVR